MRFRQERRVTSALLLCGSLACGGNAASPPSLEPAADAHRAPAEEDITDWAADDEPIEADMAGFEVRESGLGIEDLQRGDGPQVEGGDEVEVHYVGRLQDGTLVDSSRARGIPLTFRIGDGRMIKGLEEGILGMQVGGTRKLIIPSHLAYGDHGRDEVPPEAIMVFEVELLEIKSKYP